MFWISWPCQARPRSWKLRVEGSRAAARGIFILVFAEIRLGVSDLAASRRFYEAVLSVLGHQPSTSDERSVAWGDFSIVAAESGQEPTRGLHIGFSAGSQDEVDEFWRVGTAAGYRDDGAPGPRPEYSAGYYGSFLLDPDGNSAEAVVHETTRTGGVADHVWMRVADLAAARGFYLELARRAGFELKSDRPDRAGFSAGDGSFSVVDGQPSENVHMVLAGAVDEPPSSDPDGNIVELTRRS